MTEPLEQLAQDCERLKCRNSQSQQQQNHYGNILHQMSQDFNHLVNHCGVKKHEAYNIVKDKYICSQYKQYPTSSSDS